MKIKSNYKNKDYNDIINNLKTYIDSNTIIVNIGTDRCIYDSIAPLIGTFLKESNFILPIYGTIENPIHANNLEENIQKIKEKHSLSKIIAIDAAAGNIDDIGNITLKDKPISPGAGLGKKLTEIGDISLCITTVDVNNVHWGLDNTRLSLIYKLATEVKNILLHSIEKLNKDNLEVAIS
jgi:putative sporulation protein YyaC